MAERKKGPDPLPNQMSFRAYLLASEKLGITDQRIVEKNKYLGEAGGTSDWHENFELEETHRQIDIFNIQAASWRPAVTSPDIIQPREEVSDVQMGNKVEVEFLGEDDRFSFNLLGSIDQILFPDDSVSAFSPLGKTIIGLKQGDVAEFTPPGGRPQKVKVLGIFPGSF